MFQETVALETPEHVAVEFEVAGPMSRFAAALFDGMLLFIALALIAVSLVLAVAFAGAGDVFGDAASAVALVVVAVVFFGYFPIFEFFMDGQTPGKKALGIRVMRRDMAPLDFTSILLRGILRIVDMLPVLPFPLVGMVVMTLNDQGLRLGDYAAGTWVVRDQDIPPLFDSRARAAAVAARRAGTRAAPGAAPAAPAALAAPTAAGGRLVPAEYRLAAAFLERAPTLDESLRRAAAARVAAPMLRRLGESHPDAEAFLRDEVGKGGAGRSLV